MIQNHEIKLSQLKELNAQLGKLRIMRMSELVRGSCALLCIDMVNGFAKRGALFSPYVEALLPGIAELASACASRSIPCLAFLDEHPQDSPEFSAYPAHCLKNSWESQLAEELDAAAQFHKFKKHSTNGMLSRAFQTYLSQMPALDTILVTGCCTDICVLQLALSLKAWYHEQNRAVHIIVPRNLVDTFDSKGHNRVLMNAISCYLMQSSGIELVERIVLGEDA